MSWTNLPTNYADATWVGDRKYTITLANGQQQQQWTDSKIVDTTQYEPATSGGNIFYGANDANQTNDAINKIVSAFGNDINNLKVNIANGGTGATNSQTACTNLGIGDSTTQDFYAQDFPSWLSQVQSYVDQNLQPRRPFVFNAGWQGVGFGSCLAYQTLDTTPNAETKFLILFNLMCGVKYYYKCPENGISVWREAPTNVGTSLYDNSSGSNGTINLSESVANYRYIEIQYRDGDNNYYVYKVFEPNGKHANLASTDTNGYGAFEKYSDVHFDGTGVWHEWNYQVNNNNQSGWGIEAKNDIYITKIIGYK